MTSPTPIGKQSMNAPASNSMPSSMPSWTGDALNGPAAPALSDVTGSVASPYISTPNLSGKTGKKVSVTYMPVSEQLPDAIGGTVLRSAALKGEPGAAYEVGLRYAEGRGVPVNFDEAAKWYDRAAKADVVPAIFRLGTLYEKGLGVKKDVDTASRYYRQAAERGYAKAMHNLAVLEADGGGKTPNYKSASDWFRKAAELGVADSQFNLGILYARGIGVEQNLAESYKWFSLAAAQGDVDSGRKRDDIARRLDAQSLAAAKLAIQTFAPQQQPADAINVSAPAGGWDAASAPKRPVKPAKPTTSKAAAPTKTAAVLNPS
jgi:localization factor PodJL